MLQRIEWWERGRSNQPQAEGEVLVLESRNQEVPGSCKDGLEGTYVVHMSIIQIRTLDTASVGIGLDSNHMGLRG